jgi:hypothetical protein
MLNWVAVLTQNHDRLTANRLAAALVQFYLRTGRGLAACVKKIGWVLVRPADSSLSPPEGWEIDLVVGQLGDQNTLAVASYIVFLTLFAEQAVDYSALISPA